MLGQVRPPQSIFKASAQKLSEIGFKVPFNDGRVYVYSKCGPDTDLVMGQLQQAPAVDVTNDIALVIPHQGEVLDKELQVTIPTGHATFAANAYEGGWLLIDSGTAEGLTRMIKSNTAFTTGASATVTFKFRDQLDEVVAVSNTVKILANPYNGIIVNAIVTGMGSNTGRVLGVVPIDVTKAYYFWLLVRGIGPGISDAGAAYKAGTLLTAEGPKVQIMTAFGDPVIGHAASHVASGDTSFLVYYTCE